MDYVRKALDNLIQQQEFIRQHPDLFMDSYLVGVCYWCEHKIYSHQPMFVQLKDGVELRFCSLDCSENGVIN